VASRVEELFVDDLPATYYHQYPTLLDTSDARTIAAEAQRLDPAHMRVVIVGDKRAVEKDLVAMGFVSETALAELSD
jgi:hypothetical protein